MIKIADGFSFAHNLKNKIFNDKIIVTSSTNVDEIENEYMAVAIPINNENIFDVCEFYIESKHQVTIAVSFKNDYENAVKIIRENFFKLKLKVFDIDNKKTIPNVKEDKVKYLFYAFEKTNDNTLLQMASNELFKSLYHKYDNIDHIIDIYIENTSLKSKVKKSIKNKQKFIKDKVTKDINISVKFKKKILVESLENFDCSDISNDETVVICGKTGTGKTENVIIPISKNKSVVYISHLIALVEQFCHKSKGVSYLDKYDRFVQSSVSGVVINSIRKKFILNHISKADVVIFDEFEKVFKTLVTSDNSVTMKADEVYDTLVFILENAPQVIVADADFTDTTVGFLKRYRGNKGAFTLLECNANPYKEIDVELYNKTSFLSQDDLKNELVKNKVFLFDSLKTLKESLCLMGYKNAAGIDCDESALKDGILVIHSENKGKTEQSMFLLNPNEEVNKYKAIIASPCLSSGFSITENYTNNVVVISDRTLIPRELINFSRRFRTAKNIKFAVGSDARCNSFDIDTFQNKDYNKSYYRNEFTYQYEMLNTSLFLSLKYTLELLGFKTVRQWVTDKYIDKYLIVKKDYRNNLINSIVNSEDISFDRAREIRMRDANDSLDISALKNTILKDFMV